MRLIVTATLLFTFLCNTAGLAQGTRNTNTIYYLVDTVKIPQCDRAVEMGIEGKWRYYQLKCDPLKYNRSPVFAYDIKDRSGKLLKQKDIKELRFITLSSLIKIALDDQGTDAFNQKHTVYFLEPEPGRKNYFMRKVVQLRAVNRNPVY